MFMFTDMTEVRTESISRI